MVNDRVNGKVNGMVNAMASHRAQNDMLLTIALKSVACHFFGEVRFFI